MAPWRSGNVVAVSRKQAVEGVRGSAAAPGLALLAALLTTSACTGPGLEPPWSDDDEARSGSSTNAGGGMIPPPTSTGSDFGNTSTGGAGSGPAQPGAAAAGTGGAQSAPQPPVTTPPAATAGAGVVEPPVDMEPNPSGGAGGASAPSSGAGAGGLSGLGGVDFVPGCDTEMPVALESFEACRYPLPEDASVDLAALQVSAFDAGEPALLERGQSALSCVFGSDYYLDESAMPAVIVLCNAACTALPSSAQLIAIDGCPPATP